ncbi:MAG: hypothetical protein P8Y15_10105 [Gemmatimonadales bacterium]
MDIADRVVVILGGSGLVGSAIARRLIPMKPARIVIGGLWEEESREAVDALRSVPGADEIEIIPEWGDIFVRREHRELSRKEILGSDELRRELVDDIFGELNEEAFENSTLFSLLRSPTSLSSNRLNASARRRRKSACTRRRSKPT